MTSRERVMLFKGFILSLASLVVVTSLVVVRTAWPDGVLLNRMSWVASFEERGLMVPVSGPREGLWGSRVPADILFPERGWWNVSPVRVPGFLEVSADSLQQLPAPPDPCCHILIVGGSVAFGANASSIPTTYFAHMIEKLRQRSLPVKVTVLSAGAWTSAHERAAFGWIGPKVGPDLLLLLDGLNDVTVQPNLIPRFDDSNDQTPSPKPLTWDRRVEDYLHNIRSMAEMAQAQAVEIVVALQPNPVEKLHKTPLEERILDFSLANIPNARPMLRECYAKMRVGLRALQQEQKIIFIDASNVLSKESVTTFVDLWHFADPGQALLGDLLAEKLEPLLRVESRELRVESPESRVESPESSENSKTLDSGLSTLDSQLSTLDSGLSTLDSQLSTLDSQLSTLDSQLSTLDSPMSSILLSLTFPILMGLWFSIRSDRSSDAVWTVILTLLLGVGLVVVDSRAQIWLSAWLPPAAPTPPIWKLSGISMLLSGTVEQVTMFLVVLTVFASRYRHCEPVDGWMLSLAVVTGFLLGEELCVYVSSSDLGRIFTSSGILPFVLFWGEGFRRLRSGRGMWFLPVGLALAIVAHGVWNALVFSWLGAGSRSIIMFLACSLTLVSFATLARLTKS